MHLGMVLYRFAHTIDLSSQIPIRFLGERLGVPPFSVSAR